MRIYLGLRDAKLWKFEFRLPYAHQQSFQMMWSGAIGRSDRQNQPHRQPWFPRPLPIKPILQSTSTLPNGGWSLPRVLLRLHQHAPPFHLKHIPGGLLSWQKMGLKRWISKIQLSGFNIPLSHLDKVMLVTHVTACVEGFGSLDELLFRR